MRSDCHPALASKAACLASAATSVGGLWHRQHLSLCGIDSISIVFHQTTGSCAATSALAPLASVCFHLWSFKIRVLGRCFGFSRPNQTLNVETDDAHLFSYAHINKRVCSPSGVWAKRRKFNALCHSARSLNLLPLSALCIDLITWLLLRIHEQKVQKNVHNLSHWSCSVF